MDNTFSEPRAWALNWDGAALCAAADCESEGEADREASAPSVEWAPQWRQVNSATMPTSRNGHGWNGRSRPRGWALQWDGAALTEHPNGQSLSHPRVAEPTPGGAA